MRGRVYVPKTSRPSIPSDGDIIEQSVCEGKLGQLFVTSLTEYEAIVDGTDDDECHQQDHESDLNIVSISAVCEDQTYEIVKKTMNPPKKPRSPVGHAYYNGR